MLIVRGNPGTTYNIKKCKCTEVFYSYLKHGIDEVAVKPEDGNATILVSDSLPAE